MRRFGPLDDAQLAELRSLAIRAGAGATVAHPDYYPSVFREIGINPRNPDTNTFLGTTVARPLSEPDKLFIGLAYFDAKDRCDNEDAFVLDDRYVDQMKKTPFLKRFSEFGDYHRARKDFLDDEPPD